MTDRFCLLTNDVEAHSIWYNTVREKTAEKVLHEGMPALLELYKKYNVRSTFFFTGNIASSFPEVVKMVVPFGHEVGSHGWSHEVDQAFDTIPYNKQVEYLKKSRELLENLSNKEVVSFRAPAGRVNKHTPRALAETGFKIDSSVFSQRFDLFLSFGGMKKLKWLIAPRKPYYTKNSDLSRSGKGPIFEIPVSAFFMPYIGTTLRIFPGITRILRNILSLENTLTKRPIVFLTHPNEFIDEVNAKLRTFRRTKNVFSYIYRDILRHRLKIRNLGPKGLDIFEREIEFFFSKNFQFLTCRDYYKYQFQSRDKNLR